MHGGFPHYDRAISSRALTTHDFTPKNMELDSFSQSILLCMLGNSLFSGINFCASFAEATNLKLHPTEGTRLNYVTSEAQTSLTPGTPSILRR